MSGKLLLRLPANLNVSCNDNVRKEYEKYAKHILYVCYTHRTLYDSERINDISEGMKSLANLCYHHKTADCRLVKYTLSNISAYLKNVDIVTAFYVPETLSYFKLSYGNTYIAQYINTEYNIPIEIILDEHKEIPLQHDITRIEHILWLSKQTDSEAYQKHNQEEELIIDNVKYKRIILIHPCIPIYELISKIYMSSSDKDIGTDIYVEQVILDQDIRNVYYNKFDILYRYDYNELLKIKYGNIVKYM
jgi:hypothetical protein